ncbi:MAG: hypothetical protein ACREQ2_19795 [Candidatus Binatia bacterium]
MTGRKSYDQQLRTIGQSLEAQRINVFELSSQGDGYVIKGEPDKETSLLAMLRNWQRRMRSEGANSSLTFTSYDIDELDRQGRAHRAKTNRLPDFHSLPNTLRIVGSYLESKEAELIELRKHELSFSILSRSKFGHPEFEEKSLGSFYDLFVKLHSRRASSTRR